MTGSRISTASGLSPRKQAKLLIVCVATCTALMYFSTFWQWVDVTQTKPVRFRPNTDWTKYSDLLEMAEHCLIHCSVDNRRQLARQLTALLSETDNKLGSGYQLSLPSGLRLSPILTSVAGGASRLDTACPEVTIVQLAATTNLHGLLAIAGCAKPLPRIQVRPNQLALTLQETRSPYILLMLSSEPPSLSAHQLASMISHLDSADVVGGVTVAPTGGAAGSSSKRMRLSCLTLSMKYYHLKVRHKVLYEDAGCVQCDMVEGPVMLRRTLLKTVPLIDSDEIVAAGGTLLPWFLALQQNLRTTAFCADVQITLAEPLPLLDDVASLSRRAVSRWGINYIHLPNGRTVQLPCHLVTPSGSLMTHVKHSAVPPCMLQAIGEAMEQFLSLARAGNLTLRLMSGSVLAAVKMAALIPWDFDMDIRIPHEKWHNFSRVADARPLLFNAGNRQEPAASGHVRISTIDLYIGGSLVELWGSEWSRFPEPPPPLPTTTGAVDFPDGLEVRRLRFALPVNPGRAARDDYGPTYLQHAQHWRHLGKAKHSTAYDGRPAGSWLPCPRQTTACLGQFPIDGNIGVRLQNVADENW